MKDCWQNTYATYKPVRETFYTKVKKVLDAINVADVPPVSLETAPWIPAADGEVSPRKSEADLPTNRRSDDVTLADGLV